MTELLNGPLELALRALVLLEAASPTPVSRERLALLDHALVNSHDYGGPRSPHPPLPIRTSELAIKRGTLDQGLKLLVRTNLAEIATLTSELQFVAGDGAASFLASLSAEHVAKLRQNASWAWATFGHLNLKELNRVIGVEHE